MQKTDGESDFFLLSVPKMLRETIVLTTSDYQTARKYWKVLKGRILTEAGQPVTILLPVQNKFPQKYVRHIILCGSVETWMYSFNGSLC